MVEATSFVCVNEAHNTWKCEKCGDLERLEADGPFECGWDFCPHCGRRIVVADHVSL